MIGVAAAEEEGTSDRFHVRFDRADMNYLRGFCDIALALPRCVTPALSVALAL